MPRTLTPVEQLKLDLAMKQSEFASSWLVVRLLGEGVKPEELHAAIVKSIRDKLQLDANSVHQLSDVLRKRIGSVRLHQLLRPYRESGKSLDLESIDHAYGDRAAPWILVEAAVSEVSAMPLEELAKVAMEFLADENQPIVEEHPPMYFSAETVEDPQGQFEAAVAELARDGIMLGTNVSRSNFLDLLIISLRTRRKSTALLKEKAAAKQAQPSKNAQANPQSHAAPPPHKKPVQATQPEALNV